MKSIHVFTVFTTPKSFFDGQFRYLVNHGEEIILVSSFHTDAEAFSKRNGVRFVPVEMPRAMAPLIILKAICAIVKIIKTEKPDAVFGHTPVGALCAMVASKLCKVNKRIYYRHGVVYTTMTGLKREIFRLEEKFVSALSTTIVNVSYSLSRLAIRDKLNSDEKQYVIGHGTCGGIDAINTFNPVLLDKYLLERKRENLHIKEADIIYGFCGRICNDKGIPELIDGFELFQKRNSCVKAKLVLIGNFDVRDRLSDECQRQIGANRNIVVTGLIEKDVIPYFYSLLDVFVFPSHREGFGMCVIEASAMEKPILVSHVHGCEDSIVEHETGEYIELTPESICHGMELMLDDNLRRYFGKAGRKKVLEWYDTQVMWPLVLDFYKNKLK